MSSKDLSDALHRLSEAHKNNPFARVETSFEGRGLPVIQNFCACVDTNARLCFEKRYPDRKLDDIYEPYEKCGCSCHDKEDEECGQDD